MRKKTRTNKEQIHIEDLHLHTGDKLFKDGLLYATVVGESENLYFIQKIKYTNIPDPYQKNTIVECILSGQLEIDKVNF